MTVLVFGGSSQIGHFLLPRLLATGEPVLAVSRQPRPAQAGLRWLAGALPAEVPALPSLSAIVSCGPLQGLADWLARVSLDDSPRVVAISSMSAETKRDSSVPAERELSRLLRDGESALAAACARHGSAWTVLRPTLVYGAGLDRSLSPIARRAMRTRLFPLPRGRGLRQPVHADDIAQAAQAVLACPASAGMIVPVGGGERLSASEMFARVRGSLAHATLPLPLPAWLLQLGQRALPPLRGPLARLDTDLIADNGELRRLLGITPRPFRPDATMWMPPVRERSAV